MKLSLAPIQFFWQKETLLEFYVQMLDSPLDTIYLGETVCSRRQKMRFDDWFGLAQDLADSGKEIILSSQVLLESESDLKRLRKITGQTQFKIEANDMGAVKLAREHGIPFVAGASLNIYNEATLQLFQNLGAYRWVAPAEHGLIMNTREGQPFLTINGIQTMSYGSQCLLPHHADMAAIGVNILRLSPQLTDMPRIIELHRAVLDGQTSLDEALPELARLATGTPVDGYWLGKPGIEAVEAHRKAYGINAA